MELSNSNKKFWDALLARGIDQSNFKSYPIAVGAVLLEEVKSWHLVESVEAGGEVDLNHSYYLTLSYNRLGWYQLHQFRLDLPTPSGLTWHFPVDEKTKTVSNTLRGLIAKVGSSSGTAGLEVS